MTKEQFEATYPQIIGWIQKTLEEHKSQTRSVESMGFQRLPQYFPRQLLTQAKVIHVDVVPMPPLSAIGLSQFAGFENMQADGITYIDTFFMRNQRKQEESIYFHELIHVVQWLILGPKFFIAAYADGLERIDYRPSPLEMMAYTLESVFRHSKHPFDAVTVVKEQLSQIYGKQ